MKNQIGTIAAGRKKKASGSDKKKSRNPLQNVLSPRKKTKTEHDSELTDDEPNQEEVEDAIEDLDLLADQEDRLELSILLSKDQEDLKNHPIEKMGINVCELTENLLQGKRLKDTLLYTDNCEPVKLRKLLRQMNKDVEFGGTMSRKKLSQLLITEAQKCCGCTKNMTSKNFLCIASK